MNRGSGKLAFLGGVAIVSGVFAALLATLPAAWRDAAIMWCLFGIPALLFVARVYRGYVAMYTARMVNEPEKPTTIMQWPAHGGAGGREREELRVVETSAEGKHGRRML